MLINKFELQFNKYIFTVNNVRYNRSLIPTVNQEYELLKKYFFEIQRNVFDKEEWIQSELLVTIDNSIDIPIKFSIDFKKLYLYNKYYRFELIEAYLNELNIKFNISDKIYKLFKFYVNNGDEYSAIKTVSIMSKFSIKTSLNFELIEKTLNIYLSDRDLLDGMIKSEILNYIRNEFTSSEINILKNRYFEFFN